MGTLDYLAPQQLRSRAWLRWLIRSLVLSAICFVDHVVLFANLRTTYEFQYIVVTILAVLASAFGVFAIGAARMRFELALAIFATMLGVGFSVWYWLMPRLNW